MLSKISRFEKICTKCHAIKPLTDFGTKQKRLHCKTCYGEWKKKYYQRPDVKQKEYVYLMKRYFKRKFGITLEQYEEMLKAQDNKCAICRKEETTPHSRSKKIIRLAVDHCHTTGKVRGLLCRSCNQVLGVLKEDKK